MIVLVNTHRNADFFHGEKIYYFNRQAAGIFDLTKIIEKGTVIELQIIRRK